MLGSQNLFALEEIHCRENYEKVILDTYTFV